MTLMRKALADIHRRSLWQVLGIYLFTSWAGFQVAIDLVQGIGLPEWLPRLVAVLFVLGLPVILATAFVQGGVRSAPRHAAAELDPTLFPGADTTSAAHAISPGPGTRLRALLTWRRALTLGVLAFALLGLATTGWLTLRAAGLGPMASLIATRDLDPNARILIAEFEPRGVDSTLSSVVTDAFRIDFARSTVVRAVAPTEIRDVLRRMGLAELPRLDAELAQNIAVREGISAYVTGEVAAAGSGYVLSARLISTDSGTVLVALRERARGEDDVIDAVDRLSTALRERTGESLKTIRRAQPLARVTTSSLPALQHHTQAIRASSMEGNPRPRHGTAS